MSRIYLSRHLIMQVWLSLLLINQFLLSRPPLWRLRNFILRDGFHIQLLLIWLKDNWLNSSITNSSSLPIQLPNKKLSITLMESNLFLMIVNLLNKLILLYSKPVIQEPLSQKIQSIFIFLTIMLSQSFLSLKKLSRSVIGVILLSNISINYIMMVLHWRVSLEELPIISIIQLMERMPLSNYMLKFHIMLGVHSITTKSEISQLLTLGEIALLHLWSSRLNPDSPSSENGRVISTLDITYLPRCIFSKTQPQESSFSSNSSILIFMTSLLNNILWRLSYQKEPMISPMICHSMLKKNPRNKHSHI